MQLGGEIKNGNCIIWVYFRPNNILKLSPKAFMVLIAMAMEIKGPISLSQVSQKRIQQLTGIKSRDTITRAVRELKEKGFINSIQTFSGQYRPQVYLIMPRKKG